MATKRRRLHPTITAEVVEQQRCATRRAARQAICAYSEVFYHRQRRHSALGYLRPAAYEAQQRAALVTAQAA